MGLGRRFIDKAFTLPEPVEGAALIIPSRHPLQMWLMVALLVFGVLQAILGPPETSVLNELLRTTLLLQMATLVVGAGLCLLGSFWANRKPHDALIVSGTGMFFLSAVFAFYVVVYLTFLPEWYVSQSFWISVGFSAGCLHRLGQLSRQYVTLNRRGVVDPLKGF